jgi:UDP-N-acetylglucosamine 4,6-dehydratase
MNSFDQKTLLITGGTGTFGAATLQRFLTTGIREIRVFSRDEKKQDDMRRLYASPKLKFYLGDVRSRDSLRDAMKGVDYIFHAAALKQVPSCEFFPIEALRTNALGTHNVLTEAISAGVARVVVLSTDKAVYPINAMGISKAMMEKLAVASSRTAGSDTTICVTRYGNVMASRGSVIPLFLDQLLSGKPLTVTEPSMTRFMMTIEGAVDLVLFAFEHGRPGDTFVQKAPSATIGTLCEALQKVLAIERRMEIIGTRHGEKLHETLLTREEMAMAEDMGEYYRVSCDARDLNYAAYFSEGNQRIAAVDDYNSDNARRLDVAGMANLLLQLPIVQQAMRGERVTV